MRHQFIFHNDPIHRLTGFGYSLDSRKQNPVTWVSEVLNAEHI